MRPRQRRLTAIPAAPAAQACTSAPAATRAIARLQRRLAGFSGAFATLGLSLATLPARAQPAIPQLPPAPLPGLKDYPVAAVMAWLLFFIVIVMMLYGVRHFMFTMNRLTGQQRHPYLDVGVANWPRVTVFVAAHNEELVVAGCLEALLATDYPADRLKIIPVNDRSSDGTRAIVDGYASRFPGRILPFHREGGRAGKAAALKDALPLAEGDIAIIFDADYVPGRGLLKQLVAPFFDPEIGAVMGRVVPVNSGRNLLTRLLDLERSAGYQVDQQARMNMKLMPQYGGTVGGVRLSAVEAVGGWHDDTLAEDTDITYRLMFNGWKTVYTNRSECYEEVPEDWGVRIRQVRRWAKGHNQVMARYLWKFVTSPYVTLGQRIDGVMLLFVFVVPLLMLVGWALALGLYFLNAGSLLSQLIPIFALMVYGTLGNFAAFFEIVIAVLIDGNRRRLRLLPFNMLGFLVSLFAISGAVWSLMLDSLLRRDLVWDKTRRYRAPVPPPAAVPAGIAAGAAAPTAFTQSTQSTASMAATERTR